MTTRRELLVAFGVAPLAWAGAVFAQAKKPPVLVGYLSAGSRTAAVFAVFKEEMAARGWKEGSNYVLEARFADGRVERLSSLAQELAAKKPAVIVTAPTPATIAAAKAAPTTPVVQATGGSPVDLGLAKSLARPGGMVTGSTNIAAEVFEKLLELLLAAAPKVKRIGFLVDRASGFFETHLKIARRTAEHHRVEARFAELDKADEIEPAIARLAREGVQGLVVLPSAGVVNFESQRIAKLALAHRLPMISSASVWADRGALLAYGADRLVLSRRAAYFVDRILKGAKPGDLPIEQPTKFELVINMKTAKALKLEIPRDLAVRADRVIE